VAPVTATGEPDVIMNDISTPRGWGSSSGSLRGSSPASIDALDAITDPRKAPKLTSTLT
jgi:hypothetical protein